MHGKSGYTAIEMMVVLALIGIILTTALVNHSAQRPHNNLRLAGRAMISQLRHLRAKAISTGMDTSFDFYTGDNLYELDDLGEEVLPTYIRFGVPEGVETNWSGNAIPSDGVSFNGNRGAFEPNGTFSGLGGSIYLTNASNQPSSDNPYQEAVAITVNMTGRVKLYKWTGVRWE